MPKNKEEDVVDLEIIDDEDVDLSEGEPDPVEGDPDQEEDQKEESEDIPNEAKKMLRPDMKNKTKNRIVNLVKKTKELEGIISDLQMKESQRSSKETEYIKDAKLKEIMARQQEAFDDGDAKKLSETNLEMMNISNSINNSSGITDQESYFAEKNPWYNVDERKTAAARGIHAQILSDPEWKTIPLKNQLEEVAKRTNKMFKKNPYRDATTAEGSDNSRPSSSVKITRSDLALYRQMYPNLSNDEIAKKAKQFSKNIEKTNKELNYG